jgi:hypothetical protein
VRALCLDAVLMSHLGRGHRSVRYAIGNELQDLSSLPRRPSPGSHEL